MNYRRLVFAVAPVAAAAGLGGLGARQAPAIYGRLKKPQWAPPAEAFAPTWSTLYIGIGVAGWRLHDEASRRTKTLHLAQLALNATWPITFFSIRDKRTSLLIIGLLDATVAAEIIAVGREDRIAANLLTPYLAWNLFATALNIAVNDPGETTNAAT